MSVAVVIGNGVSRKSIDLHSINATTFGCNALYRDFSPDVLVAVDKKMTIEIRKSGYQLENEVWVTYYEEYDIRNFQGFNYILDEKYWSGGPTAVHLACAKGYKEVVLLGHDLVGIDGKYNNVYSDTFNYKSSNDEERGHTGTWLPQLAKCPVIFPDVKFVRVIGEPYYVPEELSAYEHITTKNFVDKYTNMCYSD